MNKVLITGVTGFIGGSLARKLLSQGVTVYGVDIETPKLDEFKKYDNFIPLIASFEEYEMIPSRIQDREIDVFYHFAWAGGFTSAIKDYKIQMSNAAYAGDALVAAKNIGVKKFVYAGTYNQYEIENFLATPGFEPRYTCIYSTGKTAASLICRTLAFNLGIEYSAGLIPMPYGENNYSKQLVNVVVDSLNKGIAPKLVEGKNTYDLIYIGDLVDALIAIGEKGKNQHEYYVGHRKLKTFKELMIDIRDVIAPDVELKFGEYKDNQKIDYSKIDLDALYRDTGFECKADFKETMKITSEWVKKLEM
ncbi:NAD-dependent epimerase/dehydratase family protein [Sporofaciens sp. SGI.106]|uniref:NAD-dependent epimerase/dehydratase family protein n=1 Tax=Sporofaciens sp. SGI.106 TaxID=3420568 RepID=UPI003D04C6F1